MTGHSVNECDVRIGDVLVGTLSRGMQNAVTFTYDETYLAKGGRSISPHMPTERVAHRYQGLPPFFSNVLSEGWLRLQHNYVVGVIQGQDSASSPASPVTGFDVLAFLGQTAIRGGTITPRQEFSPAFLARLNYIKEQLSESHTLLAGYQPKLFVREENGRFVSCEAEDATHIAKGEFAATDEKASMTDITANEHATINAAKALTASDAIVGAQMAEVDGLGRCVVIERFDLKPEGGAHRMLDFGQLLDVPPERRMDATFGQIAKFIRAHADDTAGSHFKTDERDVAIFAERVCRDLLLGNLDTHLKNFSLMERDGVWRLSPDYDLVHSKMYGDNSMALHIDMPSGPFLTGNHPKAVEGRGRLHPKLKQFDGGKKLVQLLDSLGLDRPAQVELIQNLLDRVPAAGSAIAACNQTPDTVRDSLLKNMDARRREVFEPALKWIVSRSEPAPSRPGKKVPPSGNPAPVVA